jgi:hypothetical protein
LLSSSVSNSVLTTIFSFSFRGSSNLDMYD